MSLTHRIDKLVAEVVAPASHEVDREARFPSEAIEALRAERLFSAAIPQRFGGAGLGLAALSEIAQRLARGCGSTSMIWAMHQIQVGCVAMAADAAPGLAPLLQDLAAKQALVASVTSEVGVGGDLRRSIAAVDGKGDGKVTLDKSAATISYAEDADAFLVTARRGSDSPPDDQVAALVLRDQVELEATGVWDAMGMRGTVSPGFRFSATLDQSQIAPVPFGQLAAQVMVPWSHILWGSCWYGLALEAFSRARQVAGRKRVRGNAATPDVRLAEAARTLSLLRASLSEAIEHLLPATGSFELAETARLNDLKVSASRLAVDVAETSLEVCGMPGYQERTPLSIARILRDLYSARLMISNERILVTNAELALARTS